MAGPATGVAWRPIGAAATALVIGALVYLTDRRGGTGVFGPAAGWLPSLAHTFAFALAIGVALPGRLALAGCAAWAVLEAAFEAGQHPVVFASLQPLLGDGALARYFGRGTFDPADLLAVAAGAAAAALALQGRMR